MYTFVAEKDVLFKVELSELEPERIYEHFMVYDDEVCFVLNQNQVYGIITIGDMCRYYVQGAKKLNITQKYRYIGEADYEAAEAIFNEFPTVHEVPVVVEKHLTGIVKRALDDEGRKRIQTRLKQEHDGQIAWQIDELDRITKQINGKVYLYDVNRLDPSGKLSVSDNKLLKKKKNYPSGTSGLRMMSEEEKKKFFGEAYSAEAFEEFCSDFNRCRVTIKNGICKINDMVSRNFNFQGGYRRVLNENAGAPRRIWVFGPCIALGAYVEDKRTIPTYLQELLNENGYNNYCVVNCGLFSSENVYGRVATEKIASEDIVIILFWFKDAYREGKSGNIREIFNEVYSELEKPVDNMFNSWIHCNYVVNQKLAKRLFKDIEESLTKDNSPVSERTALQDYYIPWDVVKYFRDFRNEYRLVKEEKEKCGAIVMNCNPFTKGHRYLIEQAARQVDLLYIFVVEEDKSAFQFKDRIEMVRRGTADLDNVKVIPSGKYIISKETFSQYFEKDNVEQVDDMDYDVRIFGEVVAKELEISVRFVGKEPIDKVTRKYNETMKAILPEYGIEVIEIPRKSTPSGYIISASAVRKALQEKNWEVAESMLPLSTSSYLKESGRNL